MSEDEFYQRAEAVKLDTLSDVNDIGKPWRYEEDGLTVTRTSPWSPPGCHPVGCGLKLYVDDGGRLVRVEGDENNPVTQGRLCPRCLALKDYIYNPARLLHPMKRDPKERGNADAWEQITWDEAFDIIKDEYDRITAAYGRESIVVFAGTGREGGTFAPYGTMCFGTPNFCYTQSGYACYTPRLAAIAYIAGTTVPRMGLRGRIAGPLGGRALRAHRMPGGMGQGSARVEPRRLLRPCRHRCHAPRHAPHRHRPAGELACHARRHPPAAARRHRHGA